MENPITKLSGKIGITFLFFLSLHCLFGQSSDAMLAKNYVPNSYQSSNKISLVEALDKLKKQYNISFFYNPENVENKLIEPISFSGKLNYDLEKLLTPFNLKWQVVDNKVYVILHEDISFIKGKSLKTLKKENVDSVTAQKPILNIDKLSNTSIQGKFDKNVTGHIIDGENQQPMVGVNVSIKGTTIGSTSDADGNFSIRVPEDASILVFSFIGYKVYEVEVGNQSIINVTLTPDIKSLNEVVVIGYGEQKREDVTGAISSIKVQELKTIPQVSIDQLMQGRASGVTVTNNSGQPGGSASVRIRGITSLTGSNEPLYVIDGVPVSGDGNNTSTSGASGNNGFLGSGSGQTSLSPLAAINPSDIVSVDILKDASATAIYGSRAANGVVIITTKRGKSGESKITYDMYYGSQRPSKFLDVMNLQQYAKYQNDISKAFGQPLREEFKDVSLLGKGTDWQREIFKPAPMQSHQIGISGGKDKLQYFISGGYLDQKGIIIGSNFNRYTFRVNLDNEVKPWLKTGISLTASRTKERIVLNDDINGVVSSALTSAPDVPVRNVDGTFGSILSNINGTAVPVNTVAQALTFENSVIRTRVLGNMYIDISFLKDFSFRTEFGGDLSFNKNNQFLPTYNWGKAAINAIAQSQRSNNNSTFWVLKNFLTYKHTFNTNTLTLVLGHEAQQSNWDGLNGTRINFLGGNQIQELSAGSTSQMGSGGYAGTSTLESYFARGTYSISDKYSITGTLRADGSSKFDPVTKKQWGYFPAVAAAWTISNESFMKNVSVVNNLKLRIGYGAVGNQNIPPYSYGTTLRPFITGAGTSFPQNNVANPNVTWESASQTNLGIDLGIINQRINLTVDVYNKISKNFLFQLPLPSYLGSNGHGKIDAPYVNLGKMQNKGIDVAINTRNFTGNFTWNTTFIISHYKNKVVEINGDNIIQSKPQENLAVNLTKAGYPIAQFYGYKTAGIFRDQQMLDSSPKQFDSTANGNSLGDIRYVALDNHKTITDADKTFIGSPHPNFTFGLTNNFTFKNFDLSIFLQGSQGNKILNLVRKSSDLSLDRLSVNQLNLASDHWTVDNPNASQPRFLAGSDNHNLTLSDRFVEDGSYLRIQNVTLGYVVPVPFLKKLQITRFRIYGSAQNLKTFTKYTGYDPEVGALNQSALTMGVDNGRYPSARTYTIGLNVEF